MTILRTYLTLTFILTILIKNYAQCPNPGQNPSAAFPVCGTGTFIQSSVNLCNGKNIPNPKCNPSYDDRNPYYYKFTCFESGTLGLLITPNDASSDYDWQIFDITSRNPNDIFTADWLSICSNWSGISGVTGTNGTANNLHECGGNTPNFSRWPDLVKGHEYLLMVSHFSNNQAGYKLEFKSGSAIITDTIRPQMKDLKSGCSGSQFYLKLNKPVKCTSIAADGSDWEIVGSAIKVSAASGIGCSGGFATDSILISTTAPLPPGMYSFRSKIGSDGNTLQNICDNQLIEGQALEVIVLAANPSLPDSILPVGCKPTEITLLMRDPILCNSIAPDGSDFLINGPAPVNIAGAVQVNCNNRQVKEIRIQLRRPITMGGTYTLSLKQGSDGNTLLNACSVASVAGVQVSFTAYDSVTAKIDITSASSCAADTITFFNPQANGINLRKWTEAGSDITGTAQTFSRIYTTPGTFRVGLMVSNGVCIDSGNAVVDMSSLRVKAEFEYPAFACPTDTILFIDKSTGPVISWKWNFGNGSTSTLKVPPIQFYTSQSLLSQVPVELVVGAANGCSDTITHGIMVPNNCYIAIPNAFTPNGDGLNDFLYPLNAWKATDLLFRVFNRYGQLIWETTDWSKKWDGTMNGRPASAGNYVWSLQYIQIDNGKKVVQKGTTMLIR
jgi:gliding motility-associated-like protein